jgi:hypothetical protein
MIVTMRSCASPGGSSGPACTGTRLSFFSFETAVTQLGTAAIGTSSIEADGSHSRPRVGGISARCASANRSSPGAIAPEVSSWSPGRNSQWGPRAERHAGVRGTFRSST